MSYFLSLIAVLAIGIVLRGVGGNSITNKEGVITSFHVGKKYR